MKATETHNDVLPQGFFGRFLATLVGRTGIWSSIAEDGLAWQPVVLALGISVSIAISTDFGTTLGLDGELDSQLAWFAYSVACLALAIWAVWLVARQRDDRWGFQGWFAALVFANSPNLILAVTPLVLVDSPNPILELTQISLVLLAVNIWAIYLNARVVEELAGRALGGAVLRVIAGRFIGGLISGFIEDFVTALWYLQPE